MKYLREKIKEKLGIEIWQKINPLLPKGIYKIEKQTRKVIAPLIQAISFRVSEELQSYSEFSHRRYQKHFSKIDFGFEYGQAKVTRIEMFKRSNGVYSIIGLKTPKEDLQIVVTPTGLVRIFRPEGRIL